MKYLHSRKRPFPSLYPLDLMHRAYFRSDEYYSATFSQIVSVVKNGQLEFLHTQRDIKRLQKILDEELPRKPKLIYIANKKTREVGKKLEKVYEEIDTTNLEQIEDSSLTIFFDKLNYLHEELLKYSWFPIPILPEHLTFQLNQKLTQKIKKEKFIGVFQVLTSPTQASAIEIQQQNLLALANEIKKLLKGKYIWQDLKTKYPEAYRKILDFSHKYAWVPVNYWGDPWTPQDVWKLVEEILKKDENPEITLIKRKKHFSVLAREQKSLIKKLNLSKLEQLWCAVLRDIAIIQDERKALVTKVHYYTNQLLTQMAKRTNATIIDFWWLTTNEIKQSFKQKTVDKKLINKRKKLWVLITFKDKEIVLEDKEAEKVYQEVIDDEGVSTGEIQGACASRGKARGKVRKLLTPAESNKMQKGEILVTMMTTPDFMFAMSRAAAIVTDEGGITSHAAIVSRELGIPCIVGTGNATKVLKNGEFVEVDADKGTVKKLENK